MTTEIPEDLGIKIGTQEEEFWTQKIEAIDGSLRELNEAIKVNNVIKEAFQKKIDDEVDKS